MVEVN